MVQKCEIVQVGKRRDGGFRFWCLAHRASATAKYGKQAERCVAADDPEVSDAESVLLNPLQYQGGVALWGAVPAVYDTTIRPIDRGIHVHARGERGGPKLIDQTYRSVKLRVQSDLLNESDLVVGELDAIYFMASSVFNRRMKYVTCTRCGYPHLDKDWFAVHPHKKHLCAGCGRQFSDTEEGIGNPAIRLQQAFEKGTVRRLVSADRKCKIKQRDYPGGIQIWGSNPAFVWTAEKAEEEGIHVHAFRDDTGSYSIDNTYSEVEIDGITLDADMVRNYMAQAILPHVAGRVVSLACPECGRVHFDREELAYTPHDNHQCEHCGKSFKAPGRLKRTISNPMIAIAKLLASYATRPLRTIDLGLRPETL